VALSANDNSLPIKILDPCIVPPVLKEPIVKYIAAGFSSGYAFLSFCISVLIMGTHF
jgi:hypothetical protein